jgi:hypothetical protein
VLARVRSSSSLAVSMAAGARKLRRRDVEDMDGDSGTRQWVMPSLLSATRTASAEWPAIAAMRDAVLVVRWRRVWAFDMLAAPAGMTSRLIIETIQFDTRASVLAIWRSGVEIVMPCSASRYDGDDDRALQHRFAAALISDATSTDNTLTLDVCCWRIPSSTTTMRDTVFDTPQSLLLRLTQIVERALLDVSDMSESMQRIVL